MDLFGLTITRTKAAPRQMQPLPSTSVRAGSSWWPIIREPYTGAWQKNEYVSAETALAYFAVYSCVTLIATDIAKLLLRLVQQDQNGVWTEVDNPAYSPVLRKPNRYQTINQFIKLWIISKLTQGNAYIYKEYDARPVVTAMYVLDPSRVVPLVTPDGAIYYELYRDQLSGLPDERVIVSADDIIHDPMVPLFHPLIGVSPIFACGMAAMQGLNIQANSKAFFANGANPSGMLTAPGSIEDDTAKRLQEQFSTKIGTMAVAGDGLKYEQFTMTAVDAQLIDQLKWTAENVCSCFHVPPYMIDVGPYPPYANAEPLFQKYYAQCIQSLLTDLERCLDEGLGISTKVNGVQYGTEFDLDDLIYMDTATKTKAAGDGITSGGLSPNEARRKYYGLGPVKGGDTPYMQQQMFSLAALADRDAEKPFSKPQPNDRPSLPPDDEEGDVPPDDEGSDGGADDGEAGTNGKQLQAFLTAAAAVDWTADYA